MLLRLALLISVNHDFGVQEPAPAILNGKPSDSKAKPVIY
jgi:hypothetical protein